MPDDQNTVRDPHKAYNEGYFGTAAQREKTLAAFEIAKNTGDPRAVVIVGQRLTDTGDNALTKALFTELLYELIALKREHQVLMPIRNSTTNDMPSV